MVGCWGWGRGPPPGRPWQAGGALRRAVLCATMVVGAASALSAQERPPRIEGRVVDRTTGAAVEGATISLARLREGVADSARTEAVTDRTGMFQFERALSGDYELTVTHVAYGTFGEEVTVAAGDRIALRVTLSPTAIALEPVTVEVFSEEARRDRALGTARRRLTTAQLEPLTRSGDHLANALARLLPGVRVRSGRSQPGQLVCLEFRDPASLAAEGCRTPLVIVDNVRQANGLVTLNTLPISHIRSVEAVSPGEAGVRYGADSSYGVILIETVSGGAPLPQPGEALGRPYGDRTYSWALESQPYPWAKALATAFTTNAAGLLAGYAVSRSCLSFDDLSQHFVGARCSALGNAGSRLFLYGAPQVGVGYLTRRVGATDLSRGSMWKNAVAGSVMAAPGIVLALTSDEDGFPASTEIGVFMALIGAPVATVVADRLFRRVRR